MKIIKIGGSVINNIVKFDEYLDANIYVHGGSDYVDYIFEKTGKMVKKLKSLSGVEFRYTPPDDLKYFIMGVMWANKEVVAYLQKKGINAIGLSGMDGRIVRAVRKRIIKALVDGKKKVIKDDMSGKIKSVDRDALINLVGIGTPVIAPIALGDDNQPLNVDADTLAMEIAKTLHASQLVFLTDTAFMVDGKVVNEIDIDTLEEYEKFAYGGMRRKIDMAVKARTSGVKEVIIQGLNGRTVVI